MTPTDEDMKVARAFADELRKWWTFDKGQMHMHSWHTREDFIEKKLPELLTRALASQREACAQIADDFYAPYTSAPCHEARRIADAIRAGKKG